jgi:uncharacterized LabA/DUF88 family protein
VGVPIDLHKVVGAVHATVANATAEPVDLFRAFYYHCPPYQSNPPTAEESQRYAGFRSFQNALERLPRFDVRLGHLQVQGHRADGSPIFGQKQVDLLLGLDIALLSGKGQITHAALVAGDSDLVPAIRVAKQEGVATWLFHGPSRARDDGASTYSQELWQIADDRSEMDELFWQAVRR